MEFADQIAFADMGPIGQVCRTPMIACEMHLQKSVRSMRNRLDVPDGQGKPLPERPETQETTCMPRSCAKRQSPSKAHTAAGGLPVSDCAGLPPLFYLPNKKRTP